MISPKLILKVLLKPRSVFEELKDDTTVSDGIVIFLFISVISLLLYSIASKTTSLDMIFFQFGFGNALNLKNAFIYLPLQFFSFVIIALIAGKIALKFGGKGTFSETFSFLCYSNSFNIVNAVASAITLLWFKGQINATLAALNSKVLGPVNFIVLLFFYASIISIIFGAWLLYIMTEAISVSYGISRVKGFLSLIASYLIMAAIAFLILILLGKPIF